MTQATEEIARQFASAAVNRKNWSTLLYNVKTYGALGDGVTDDTAAIQDCIDDVIAKGGGIVFFPDGTYLLKSLQNLALEPYAIRDPNLAVQNADNIKILGTGNVTLKTAPPGNLSYIMLLNQCTNVEIAGIHFDGDNTGLATSDNNAGLGIENIVGLYVHDCTFSGLQGSYFVGDWIFNAVVERCRFTVQSGSAFDLAFLQDFTVRDCDMRGNGMGVNGLGTQGFQCVYDSPQASFNNTGETLIGGVTNNITLECNRISGFRTGIYLADLMDSHIIGNHIFNNYVADATGNWGIAIGNSQASIKTEGLKIESNIIYGNGSGVAGNNGGAITITAGSAPSLHVDITNNDIFDNPVYGIRLNSGTNTVTMRAKNNRLYNRSGSSQTTNFTGFGALTTDSIVIDNEGYNPQSFSVLTPGLPAGTTAANAVTNNNPFPVTIYQLSGTGLHIITPSGTDRTIGGGNQTTIRLLPYHKIYFATANTAAWTWSGE